jgi:hypothetical protein
MNEVIPVQMKGSIFFNSIGLFNMFFPSKISRHFDI